MTSKTDDTKRGGRRPALDDEVARDQALAAAERLYYSRGIQSVGMDALSRESGVGLKRLYQLFDSKESIVEEVLLRIHGVWERDIRAAAGKAGSPRERLLAIYDFLGEWFAQDTFRGCVFINSFGELGATSPSVARSVREHKQGFQEYVSDLAEEAGASRSLGRQLAILAEGAQTTAAIAGERSAADEAKAAAAVLIASALD